MPHKLKIDLHVHCQEHSPCSSHPASSIVESAVAHGLHAIAFTNHDSYMEPSLLGSLRSSYPSIKIYNCVEISIGIEHFLYIGPYDPHLVHWRHGYERLWREVRDKGGFLILAHPFRFSSKVDAPVEEFPPDGVELHSTNTGSCDAADILKLAKRLGSKTFSNSDGHAPEHIGIYRNLIEAPAPPPDEASLARALRSCAVLNDGDAGRIALHNEGIAALEEMTRKFIASGKGPIEYEALTGKWRGYYDRVNMGKSYSI